MKRIEAAADGTVIFDVRLVPRASRNEIIGWTGTGELKVRVTAPPVDQAANLGLVQLLAKTLGISRGQIGIVAGAASRRKRLAVPEMCKNRLLSYKDI